MRKNLILKGIFTQNFHCGATPANKININFTTELRIYDYLKG